MATPKGPTPILILAVVLLVVAALIYGVRRHDKKEKAAAAAAAAALRDIAGAPLTQQLTPPGGFTLEQQVVLGENA